MRLLLCYKDTCTCIDMFRNWRFCFDMKNADFFLKKVEGGGNVLFLAFLPLRLSTYNIHVSGSF